MKRLAYIIFAVCILAFITSCSGGDNASFAAAEDVLMLPMTGGSSVFSRRQAGVVTEYWAYESPAIEMSMDISDEAQGIGGTAGVEWGDIANQSERHVIQTAEVKMETENYDYVISVLRGLAPTVDGYIQSESSSSRDWRVFSIVLRVPAREFYGVLQNVESLGNVLALNQQAQDVTDSFYDMIGSLEVRRIEEDRLLALIDQAQNINEILALEQRLSSVRLNIEMYLSQLNDMAGQIAYSTIIVTVMDIYEEEIIIISPTLGSRIGIAFGDSISGTVAAFQTSVIFLAGAIIPIMVVIAIGIGVYIIVRPILRKKAKQS